MVSIYPAHAPVDAPFARELGEFLEIGCEVSVASDAAVKPGEDLISAAETGLSADILLLVVSPASNPAKWVRERWEPLLFEYASAVNTQVAVFLLEECSFPPLLRRKLTFFDATSDRLVALRRLKRWLRNLHIEGDPGGAFSPDLETLYRDLADRPGMRTTSGEAASRFAEEAARDFDAIFWIPAYGRSLAQIAGELGSQLSMTLDGSVEENCSRIGNVLSGRRCLVVLDAPRVNVSSLVPAGRTSVLFTRDPVRMVSDRLDFTAARRLVTVGRLAEAYEAFYRLIESGVSMESCARELVWICERWDRLDEANALRIHFRPAPSQQLRLF